MVSGSSTRSCFGSTIDGFLALLGFMLWFPGIALLNVAGAWGLQATLLIVAILGLLVIVQVLLRGGRLRLINTAGPWFISHTVFVLGLVLCTMFSQAGLEESGLTLGVELLGISFSLVLSWWLCSSMHALGSFLHGFRFGGLISAGYAIYQFVALRQGLPFDYISMNNASFSILDIGSARYLGRSLAVTPEPSILASLLLILIGLYTIDLVIFGGWRRYIPLLIAILAFLTTMSLSLILALPFLFLLAAALYLFAAKLRNLRLSDITAVALLVCAGLIFFLTNPTVVTYLNRVLNPQQDASVFERFEDLFITWRMFSLHPITGWGPGSLSLYAADFQLETTRVIKRGVSSGFLRIIVEQGIIGLVSIAFITIYLTPTRLPRGITPADAVNLLYPLCFIFGAALPLIFFASYRNLYHLWLILPMGLCLKAQLTWLRAEARQRMLATTGAVSLPQL